MPMTLNHIHEISIHAVAYGGDGVGRLADGMTVFVPYAAVGDRLRVRVVSSHKQFMRAGIVEMIAPGPARVNPPCPHYGICGGCQYQHLAAQTQVELKADQLRGALRRIGGLREIPVIEEAVPAEQQYGYRNRIALSPARKAGRIVGWGYTRLDNFTLIQITGCPIAHEDLNAKLVELLASGEAARFPSAEEGAPLVLRRSRSGETLAFRDASDAMLTERVLDRTLAVPAGAFFQINPPVLDGIVAWLRAALEPSAPEMLIDAYCGCGVFAIAAGDLVGGVIGIEGSPDCAQAAAANARAAGLPNARFVCGKVEAALAEILRAHSEASRLAVILDPPRAGLSAQVTDTLLRYRPRTLALVSCNPPTLARDLARLNVGKAYHLSRLALFDMFPQTAYLEAVAILSAMA